MQTIAFSSSAYTAFDALIKKRAFFDAARIAERQVTASNDTSEFWLTQLSCALRGAGRPAEALEAAEKACTIAPGNPWALLARADAQAKKGKFSEACIDFEEAQRDGRVVARARQGMLACLFHLQEWYRILSLIAQWGFPPAEARPWRAKALFGLKRFDESTVECRAWLSESAENPSALRLMTDLDIERDGLDAVRARMERLVKTPGKAKVYGEIYATLCKRAGSMKSAADQYEKLVRAEASPGLIRKQAFALAKSGEEARAVPLMEELLRLAPADLFVHAAYIPACKRLGDPERAWKFYHELITLHPEEKTLYGRLKKVQRALETAGEAQGREGMPF